MKEETLKTVMLFEICSAHPDKATLSAQVAGLVSAASAFVKSLSYSLWRYEGRAVERLIAPLYVYFAKIFIEDSQKRSAEKPPKRKYIASTSSWLQLCIFLSIFASPALCASNPAVNISSIKGVDFSGGGTFKYSYRGDGTCDKIFWNRDKTHMRIEMHDGSTREYVVEPSGTTTVWKYNNGQRKTKIVYKDGHIFSTKNSVDGTCKIVRKGPNAPKCRYDYNIAGQLVRKFTKGEMTEYIYNEKGEAIEILRDMMGKPKKLVNPDNSSVEYDYNDKGNVMETHKDQTGKIKEIIHFDRYIESYRYEKDGSYQIIRKEPSPSEKPIWFKHFNSSGELLRTMI